MCGVVGISSQISLMKNANYNSPHKTQSLTPCLDAFFCHSISFIHHLSLITLKYHVCLAPSLTSHHSIFFTLFVSLIPVTRCSFFFFLQYPNSPSLVKKKNHTQNMKTELVKEKKKSKGGQKVRLSTVCGSPMCV